MRALREDLGALIVDGAADPAAMAAIVEILCGVDRPESVLTWKRSPKVRALLAGLASGEIPLSHEGLDNAGKGTYISHLRSLLEHNGLLAPRDEHLARFEAWLASKLDAIPAPGYTSTSRTIRHLASPATSTSTRGARASLRRAETRARADTGHQIGR
jgi:hypothetical protein